MLRHSKATVKQGVKAWIVTWEWIGDHAKRRGNKIAAILNPRLSAGRVRDLVEFLYMNDQDTYTLSERLDYALRPKRNPYRARVSRGIVECGHHPFLLARLVDDLVIEIDERGHHRPRWKKRPNSNQP